jgi:hypothetical protein
VQFVGDVDVGMASNQWNFLHSLFPRAVEVDEAPEWDKGCELFFLTDKVWKDVEIHSSGGCQITRRP